MSRIVNSVPDVVAIVIYNEGDDVLASLNKQTIEQSHLDEFVSTYEKDIYTKTKMSKPVGRKELATRAEETNTRLPIIALTANAMQSDKEKCLDAGMDCFLTKPIEKTAFEQTILETLEKLINERKAALLHTKYTLNTH